MRQPRTGEAAQVWEIFRKCSNEDLFSIQNWIIESHPLLNFDVAQQNTPSIIRNQMSAMVSPVKFVDLFLDFLHRIPISNSISSNRPGEKHLAPSKASKNSFELNTEHFPSLEQSANKVGMRKKNTKRRITTTLVTTNSSNSIGFSIMSSSMDPGGVPEITSSANTLKETLEKASLLEKRMTKLTPEDRKKRGNDLRLAPSTPSKIFTSYNPFCSQVNLNRTAIDTVDLPSIPAPIENMAQKINHCAAKFYGFLISYGLIDNLCFELQFLLDLLVIEEISYQKYEEFHDFSIRENCVEFAAESLIQLENILLSLDYNFLSQIILILQEKKICGNLVESLNTKIAEKDELRVRESTRTGMKLPVESTDPASCDFTLPFFEEIDSRLHYKTQVESLLYINREKTRDGFLSLLRQYQKQQNSLEGIENVSFASMASEEARSLFTSILPENRWWFSKFFVMELIQIGSNIFGENDKDLLKKIVDDKVVGKSSDRLRKLHRRFSSQKSSSAQDRRNDHRIQMSGISSDHTPIIIGSTQSQSCGEANTRLFLDNQLFFYHFLRSCDSHELSQLINTQIESHLLLFISKESDVDPRKHFTEQVLRLKVLGKFLGYLHFSSNWNSMPLYLHNPAVEKARKEATNCLDQLDPRFDVMKYLERSIERCEIVRDMPWISDYLMMLSHDRISLTTKYFRRVLLLLRWVQTGQRLLSMGENGILIYIQIDHLLQVLHAHKFLKNATDVSSIRLSKGIFVQSNVCQSLSNPHALDYLPFLCNQIYIQGCVCDLEEFKDFIHSRLCMSRRTGKHEARVSTSSSIRKLRPMQISDELTNSMTAIMPPSIAPHSLEEENSNRSLSSLELAFFKLHSDIQRNVEFAIGVVVRNSFEYTANWVVIPGADSLVDNLLTEIDEDEGLGLSIGHKSRGHKFEMRLNKVLEEKSRCCCELAAQTAKDFCLDRVEKAVLSLVSPSLGTTLCQVIVKIAIKRAVFALESLMERMARKEFLDRIKMRKKALFKITVEQVPALTVSEVDLKLNNSFDLDVNRTLVSTFSRHSGKEKPVYEIAVAIRQISAEVFKISNQVDASLELTTITTRMRILMKNSKKILKSFGLITPTICACLWRVMLSSSRLTYRLSKYLIRFNVDELSPAFEKAVVEYSNRLSSIIEVALVSCHEQKRAYNWAQELTRRFIRILVHVDKPLVCARSYRLYSLPIASVISTVEAICPGANAPIIQEYFGLEEEIDLIVRLADNLNKKVLIS